MTRSNQTNLDVIKCLERHGDLANKKWFSNCIKSLHRVLMTIKFMKEEMETVGDMSNACSQIVLKCLYVARIGLSSFNILYSSHE